MLESQISQLAISILSTSQGKIPGQPEELESANLIDIFNAGFYFKEASISRWMENAQPAKKGDLGGPVIPIRIRPHTFKNALCDYGSSINIMPKVIYEKIHGDLLLYTITCLQLADQSLCYPRESFKTSR